MAPFSAFRLSDVLLISCQSTACDQVDVLRAAGATLRVCFYAAGVLCQDATQDAPPACGFVGHHAVAGECWCTCRGGVPCCMPCGIGADSSVQSRVRCHLSSLCESSQHACRRALVFPLASIDSRQAGCASCGRGDCVLRRRLPLLTAAACCSSQRCTWIVQKHTLHVCAQVVGACCGVVTECTT